MDELVENLRQERLLNQSKEIVTSFAQGHQEIIARRQHLIQEITGETERLRQLVLHAKNKLDELNDIKTKLRQAIERYGKL